MGILSTATFPACNLALFEVNGGPSGGDVGDGGVVSTSVVSATTVIAAIVTTKATGVNGGEYGVIPADITPTFPVAGDFAVGVTHRQIDGSRTHTLINFPFTNLGLLFGIEAEKHLRIFLNAALGSGAATCQECDEWKAE